MSNFPENTRLGKLKYLEIYGYYDRPCLFSCHNETGQIYLAVWVDEVIDCNRWLYTAITPTRYKWLKEGVIDIRSAFAQAVSGFVYDVRINNQGVANAEMLSCSTLTDDLLPAAGELLKHR